MTTAHTLGTLGEQAVLARIFPRLPHAASAIIGPGDDAAVLATPDGRTVVTTDMMVHGPDFRLAWSSPYDLGWKAAATNLADVAAMGAAPTALVVALAVPVDTPVDALERFADGLRDACDALAPSCGVVGGDLSVTDTMTIAVTAFGDLAGAAPVLRSGARPGDVVAVAGDLALAAAGIRLLFAEAVDAHGMPDADAAARLAERHPEELRAQLRPSPPITLGVVAARAGATAMLDVSDGLALDARRIARASGVALDLRLADVGSPEALEGGEAHALLATFPPEGALPEGFRPIGLVVEGESVLVDGEPYARLGGWDPYADWNGARG
ncbi:thiamine-monophosphate kinase [Diaminobutyricimonas aerilata]|uniref:Thiamine-monophosphate kinase n=1 Tax=Diaminobutyricimonas aerilata TaxID=1162967 RepID=A0A2M9CID3_9MICO|nr:thiamine-phosphate kinase [Diaminobutyricimonas aerilata]PJJ71686.1 thiamine-monophosphate kinase [Diaminobutyricimonas aerilata]